MAFLRGAVFLAATLCVDFAHSDEIPLKEIWAVGMPGTKNLQDMKPTATTQPLIKQIAGSLGHLSRNKKPQGGFVLAGSPQTAIQAAANVFASGNKPRNNFSTAEELTLVFFSHQSDKYVHIQRVIERNSTFEIQYLLVPHDSKELTSHIALIPLGKLKEGQYKVIEVEQGAGTKRQEVVCGPFDFSIENQTEKGGLK